MKQVLVVSLLVKMTLSMDYQQYLDIYGYNDGYSLQAFLKNVARIEENKKGNSDFIAEIN
jgi:uncharacterized protein YdeI (YjbR/CyaY-like superfamily)